MSATRVLVTGASGFIGSHLADALSARGHAVRALVKPMGDKRFLEGVGVGIVEGGVTDAGSVRYDLFFTERVYRNAKSKRELGFRPRGSIREGVHEMVGWHRERSLI